MIGADGYLWGAALGKRLTDKEFYREKETLELRISIVRGLGGPEHPAHLGMINTTNALLEEVFAIAAGTMQPSERRLSDPKNTIHLDAHFQKASKDAALRLTGGKQTLRFSVEPNNVMPRWLARDTPKFVPVGSRGDR